MKSCRFHSANIQIGKPETVSSDVISRSYCYVFGTVLGLHMLNITVVLIVNLSYVSIVVDGGSL